MPRQITLAAILIAAMTTPAFAHLAPGQHGSFAAGMSHPLFGLDHILAMVTVGLWAALLGGRAVWLVPGAFVGAMALGFGAAMIGLPLPFVEPVILTSVVTLGLIVAIALPVPAVAGMAVAGLFALFHGHAHGSELGVASALPYGAGFMIATALLHAAGIGIGLFSSRLFTPAKGAIAIRITGALVAVGGTALAFAV